MTTRQMAARERALNVAQRGDRPSQRRCAERAGSRAAAHLPAAIEIRGAADPAASLDFVGLATAYEYPYGMYDWYGEYTEIISAGAATKTLATAGLDVPLVLGHDQLRRLARTTNGSLTLTETEQGLEVLAAGLDIDDVDVAYIVPKLRAGLIDEMSFAFRITRGHWSPDYTEYRIDEFDIHRGDVAIVGFGASDGTAAGMRSAPTARDTHARALLELALRV